MSYCLNPNCPNPENPDVTLFCVTCGTKLILKDRYRAIKPIGQGGFGITYLAVDEDKPSKPPCVIKQFFPLVQGASNLQKASELFTQEAVQLDELGKHPQIPDLLAYFIIDNQQYLVQEFIDGQTLSQELAQKGIFNEIQIRQLLNDLLPVLQFVHSKLVIHRDIKPDNIIRRKIDRKLFLVDFGAAKTTTGKALQQTGTSIGSPEYVAPEQSRGRAVFSSDIYSLAVTCIHLLTGMSPFDLFDMNQDVWVWRQFLKNPVSNQMGKILDKMLDNAIDRRYQSVADILKDLNIQTPPAATPKPQTPTKQTVKPSPVTPAIPVKSKIDDELAQLKSEFINPAAPKKNQPSPSQQTPSPNSTTAKSQIDKDLEELRSQFGQNLNN
ncbi:serine/threonine-protein kinase [Argonema antarcticum]|uniref:protein kinase domain-containing protein n=1 Tax=Argonema antarcticum TaxID=2942763 RepID=UPI0020121E94|nr:serine/threonine-protein kinase [Argonema antarcticum]MCL1473308.1 protein kinase [Argonema antarcticum A004/B2]